MVYTVGRDPEARQEVMALGLLSLPVLVIGSKRFSGFAPRQIDAALAEEARGLP